MELEEIESKIQIEKAEAKVEVYSKVLHEYDDETAMAIGDIPVFEGDTYTESFVRNLSSVNVTSSSAVTPSTIPTSSVLSTNLVYTSHSPIPSTLKPNITPFQPSETCQPMSTAAQIQTQVDSVVQHQPQQETNQLMSDIFKELRAPTVQLDPFDGNPMDFPFFMAKFVQAVEMKIEDGKGRLARLIQFTAGPAKELAKSCTYLSEEICYSQAKKLLTDKYGNHFVVNAEYRKMSGAWPRLKANDVASFTAFENFLIKFHSSVTALGRKNDYNPELLPSV